LICIKKDTFTYKSSGCNKNIFSNWYLFGTLDS
jgi:hypothetical protein